MRRYFYLITESEHYPEAVGRIEVSDVLKTPSAKNEETTHWMADWTDGPPGGDDCWTRTLVSCGHADFADEDDYKARVGDVAAKRSSK